MSDTLQLATFGGGCFWCTEAIFRELKGVTKVVSGYAGGSTPNPTYEEVCGGKTGHAEVIQVSYDPDEMSYEDLLEVFWKTHDPTTRNQQGGDSGEQYRSIIFYRTEEEKHSAEKIKRKLEEEKAYPNPIVTAITPYTNFYPAEGYHQEYFEKNSDKPYCIAVIDPKLRKFKKQFAEKLK